LLGAAEFRFCSWKDPREFIISGAEHEYLDPSTTTYNTNSNPQNYVEILLDLWHNDDRNLHEW
jgi:hypothetical protein